MPKYIDVHAHVNFKAFDEDREEVLRRALENDTWVVNVGTQVDTSRSAIELAHKYEEGVYAIIGLHPIHTGKSHHDEQELGEGGAEFARVVDVGDVASPRTESASPTFTTGFTSRGEVFDKNIYREFLKDSKVVAIGECGLDYYHMDEESIERQKKTFIEQIELANEIGKPLMIHTRNGSAGSPQATERNVYFDVWEILKEHAKVSGVFHFFAGSVEDMQRLVDIGFYISFAGPITYKPKIEICDYVTVVKATPLDRILTDSDSPYVAPVPHRGKRNEPIFIREIVKKIAEIKNLPEDEVARTIIQNAKKVFNI